MDRKVAVITGANRGIGLETARQMGKLGWHVILTARDATKGAAALKALQRDGLDVELRKLDITRSEDARALAQYIGSGPGRVDALVNNAGILPESSSAKGAYSADPLQVSPTTVMEILNTNMLGPLRMIQALAPLMPPGACIVNLSSGMGSLTDMSLGHLGYRSSKAGLNVLTIQMSQALADKGIKVNSVCPGWVRTEMGGSSATRSPEQAAKGIVWAATLPADGPTGGFFRDGKPVSW